MNVGIGNEAAKFYFWDTCKSDPLCSVYSVTFVPNSKYMYCFMMSNIWLWIRRSSWPWSAKSVTFFSFRLRPCLPRFTLKNHITFLPHLSFYSGCNVNFRVPPLPSLASEFFPWCPP